MFNGGTFNQTTINGYYDYPTGERPYVKASWEQVSETSDTWAEVADPSSAWVLATEPSSD